MADEHKQSDKPAAPKKAQDKASSEPFPNLELPESRRAQPEHGEEPLEVHEVDEVVEEDIPVAEEAPTAEPADEDVLEVLEVEPAGDAASGERVEEVSDAEPASEVGEGDLVEEAAAGEAGEPDVIEVVDVLE